MVAEVLAKGDSPENDEFETGDTVLVLWGQWTVGGEMDGVIGNERVIRSRGVLAVVE